MKKQENKKGLICYFYPWAFVTRQNQIQKKSIYTTTNKLNYGEVTEVFSQQARKPLKALTSLYSSYLNSSVQIF